MAATIVWLACPACGSAKSAGFEPGASVAHCRACRREVRGQLLARAWTPAAPPPLAPVAPLPGDAVCFYDPTLKATALCSQCGVLASDAWSAKWGSQWVCLRCLEKLRQDGRDSRFESGRVMWDNVCLLLALVGLVIPYFAVFTAPAALVFGVRGWNRPRSMVARSRMRLVVALVLASLEVLGLLALLFIILTALLSQ